jgi:hypothetical protein
MRFDYDTFFVLATITGLACLVLSIVLWDWRVMLLYLPILFMLTVMGLAPKSK